MALTLKLTLTSVVVVTSSLAAPLACRGTTDPDRSTAFEIIYSGPVTNTSSGFIVMDETGSQRRVLARPSDAPICPSLSPDGNRLLYGGATTNQVFMFDLRTGVETQLTQGTLWSQCPAWSPDGTLIAFFQGPSTAPNGNGIYVMRADGSNVRELAAGGFSSNGVEWSPDSRWIAVTNLDFRLVLMDPTTGGRGPVLTPTSIGYLADFSPDGKEIAYTVESGRAVDIYVSNIDGSNARSLTSSDTVSRYHSGPRWSPDGKLLTYWSFGADTVTRRSVPAVFLISRDGARIDWKERVTIYGDQAIWRRAP